MRSIDTNVLVRLITGDHAEQTERAEKFVAGNAWVSLLVLAETTWVLESVYDLPPKRISLAIEMLLDHQSLAVQDAEVARAALQHLTDRPKLGFSDCLTLEIARKAGHTPLGTFDIALSRVEGAERL